MTGPKLNEKSYVTGERSGTKATARRAKGIVSMVMGCPLLISSLSIHR